MQSLTIMHYVREMLVCDYFFLNANQCIVPNHLQVFFSMNLCSERHFESNKIIML